MLKFPLILVDLKHNYLNSKISCATFGLLNILCLASRGVPAPSFGYGYAPPPFPGAYGPPPGSYVMPQPASGAYIYMPAQMNGYGVAPQPMGYPYAPPPGEFSTNFIKYCYSILSCLFLFI